MLDYFEYKASILSKNYKKEEIDFESDKKIHVFDLDVPLSRKNSGSDIKIY